MPITDLYDRSEGYGHDQGTQATKDDGDWDTQPELPDAEERMESTSDRLYRSVDTKHAWEGPEDYDGDPFVGEEPLSPYRRTMKFEWTDGYGDLVREDNGIATKTYQGENERLDIESTEASGYNRPVNTWDSPDVDSQGAYTGLPGDERLGYRNEDGEFEAEVADPNNGDAAFVAKPARSEMYDTDEAAPQPPPEDELESEQDLVDLYDPNLDPPVE